MNIKRLTCGFAAMLAIAGAAATISQAKAEPPNAPTFTPENYTNGTKPMMPLIMKVTLPPDKMQQLRDMMRAGANSCFIDDLDPGDASSLVMICGLRPSAEIFSNN